MRNANSRKRAEFFRLVFAGGLMVFLATLYSDVEVDAENFALGKENQHVRESLGGAAFTASSVPEIKALVDKGKIGCGTRESKTVIWFGNSQLHTINQYKAGEHLAPYWLKSMAAKPDCFQPYGISLPNANFQEYLVLLAYIRTVFRPDAVVLSLVFDDLREDGLRDEFSMLMVNKTKDVLAGDQVGTEITALFQQVAERNKAGEGENGGLEGFVQKRFEDSLTRSMDNVIPLWAARPNLRARLLTDLYFVRNYALGINPTTVRRQIAARYQRNMAALEAILAQCNSSSVPVVLYVAPIRQDFSLPYDREEYDNWKREVSNLAGTYRAQLLNLEAEVPRDMWGTYHKDDVDFMHFQGRGHVLLARAVAPAIRRVVGEF